MPAPALRDLLHVAIEAAELGGRRTLAYFNTGVQAEYKADSSPVTQADREAEALIRARIAKSFPTHSILGEEQGATPGDPDYRWIIDPLDGTKSFVQGVPLYGALVGVEVQGEPVAGVIYHPALNEMVYAAKGLGCFWNGRPARVTRTTNLKDAVLCNTNMVRTLARSDAFLDLAGQVKMVRGWGDCYGYTLVATGRCDIMLDPALNAWDCAPMLPILEEAGGKFSSWKGERTIHGGDGAATNGALFEQVSAVLKREVRKA